RDAGACPAADHFLGQARVQPRGVALAVRAGLPQELAARAEPRPVRARARDHVRGLDVDPVGVLVVERLGLVDWRAAAQRQRARARPTAGLHPLEDVAGADVERAVAAELTAGEVRAGGDA